MFTDKSIKGLKAKPSAYRLYEKGPDKGFGVKVTPAGSVAFLFNMQVRMANKNSQVWDGIHRLAYLRQEISVVN